MQFFRELERRIQNLPGVAAVAMMSDIPATGGFRWPVLVGNQPVGAELPRVGGMSVTPSFLNVLDAPIIEGRGFRDQDRIGTEPVVLINESFAHRFFPDQRPVGRTIRIGRNAPDQPPTTIVGVVPDLFAGGIEEEDGNGPGIYLPLAQNAHVSMQVMVRAVGDPVALTSQIRDAIESLDPTLALMDVDRVDRLIARGTLVFDVFGKLFLFFGLAALFLASIGLYGVMAFTVSQKTREWGVRMALGAAGGDVVLLVLKQGLKQIIVGLSAGLVLAGALSVPMADIFYQVEPWDGSIFAIIAVILSVTGLLAIFLPALRATRVDPMEALRYE
ncbi:MAG: ABC transporter permease [Gemmatimonadetes bacterium]|nr:ABC transporter permease [Gemmatimonadota bacterium]